MQCILFGIFLAVFIAAMVTIMVLWASFCDSFFKNSLVGFFLYMVTSLVVLFGLVIYLSSKQ